MKIEKFSKPGAFGIMVGYDGESLYQVYMPETSKVLKTFHVRFIESERPKLDENGKVVDRALLSVLEEATVTLHPPPTLTTSVPSLHSTGLPIDDEDEDIELGDIQPPAPATSVSPVSSALSTPPANLPDQSPWEQSAVSGLDVTPHPRVLEDSGQLELPSQEENTTEEPVIVPLSFVPQPIVPEPVVLETIAPPPRQNKGKGKATKDESIRRSTRLGNLGSSQHTALIARAFVAGAAKEDDNYDKELSLPVSLTEALAQPDGDKWKDAVNLEYKQLLAKGTWELATLPPGRKALTGKWVFVRKKDAEGKIVRQKARYVVRGFEQKSGVDYFETYAAVVRAPTFRLFFALAALNDWECEQLDIETAFLNSPIEEEIYMQQPIGFEDGTSKVCRLRRTLYGLKQSPGTGIAPLRPAYLS
jgi:hypothetical protein